MFIEIENNPNHPPYLFIASPWMLKKKCPFEVRIRPQTWGVTRMFKKWRTSIEIKRQFENKSSIFQKHFPLASIPDVFVSFKDRSCIFNTDLHPSSLGSTTPSNDHPCGERTTLSLRGAWETDWPGDRTRSRQPGVFPSRRVASNFWTSNGSNPNVWYVVVIGR